MIQSELSFLIDLYMNPKLPKAIKATIADRIREVERKYIMYADSSIPLPFVKQPITTHANGVPQAASTLALMAKHGDIVNISGPPIQTDAMEPPPVTVIAQTQAAAAAMQSRNEAIAASIAGKTDKITGRPKKW